MKTYDLYPIYPKSSIRRCPLIILLVLTASAYLASNRCSVTDLFAFEIPQSLLTCPTISESKSDPEQSAQTGGTSITIALNDAPHETLEENFEFSSAIDGYCSDTIFADDPFHTEEMSRIPENGASVEMGSIYFPVSLPDETVDKASKESIPPLKKAGPEQPFIPIIMKAARKYEVDPAIIKAIIRAESGYNPKAVSKSGARGLMQLMPRTAKSLGVDNIFCPEQNILAGVQYFKKLLNQFKGDIKLALAAYNAGSRKVKEYKGIPPFKTTRLYIKKVFEYHRHYKLQVVENG